MGGDVPLPRAEVAGGMDDKGSNTLPLSRVAEGQRARIVAVRSAGALRRRILEMGLTRGTELVVEKYAPLKDPIEVIVKGFHISLRVEEAAHISVEILK
jgi:Fe2+ transport system protein FeoA